LSLGCRNELVLPAPEGGHDLVGYPGRFGIRVASAFDGHHRGNAGGSIAVKPVNGKHLLAVEEVPVNRRVGFAVP
jgi:hypothetical protein